LEVSITKMSQNGQIVIPSEIRRDAGIKPSTQFLIFNEDGNILLKQINSDSLKEDLLLIDKIRRSNDEIKKGKFVKADTSMSDEEIDKLLMG
jgi:AbrB family looped-hinge helix DNA binding protein